MAERFAALHAGVSPPASCLGKRAAALVRHLVDRELWRNGVRRRALHDWRCHDSRPCAAECTSALWQAVLARDRYAHGMARHAAVAIAYTVYSEWLNVNVRRSWAYSELMPTVPIIGTGVGPLLQWIALPTLVQWFAIARAPWIAIEQGSRPPPLDTG